MLRAFHHPAIRDEHVQIQKDMFETVRQWANDNPKRHEINNILSSESVRAGKNHIIRPDQKSAGCGGSNDWAAWTNAVGQLGHGKVGGSLWSQVQTRDLGAMEGKDGRPQDQYLSSEPAPPGAVRPERPLSTEGSHGYGHGNGHGKGHGNGHNHPTGGAADDYLRASSGQGHQQYSGHTPPPPSQYYQSGPPQGSYGQGPYGQGPPPGPYGQPPPGAYGQGPPPSGYWGGGPPPPSGPGGYPGAGYGPGPGGPGSYGQQGGPYGQPPPGWGGGYGPQY